MTPRERCGRIIARCFATFGAAGRFTPAGGSPFALQVLPKRLDIEQLADIFAPTEQTGRAFAVQVDDVSERPKRGDTIEILEGGFAEPGVYTVAEEAMSTDSFSLVWVCRVGDPV